MCEHSTDHLEFGGWLFGGGCLCLHRGLYLALQRRCAESSSKQRCCSGENLFEEQPF